MKIPKRIAELTALALKDKVLTPKERSTIVETARKYGVPAKKINEYLDRALRERIKQYSLEELTHCPHCGALMPLVAEDCPFCLRNLRQSATYPTVPPPHISGKDVDIIKHENLVTAQELRNIDQCPNCGAPFPLFSNICKYCGHILQEQSDSELNARNLNFRIKQSIIQIKNAYKPTFRKVLEFRLPVVLLFAAVLFLILTFSYNSILMCLLSFPCLLLSFIMLIALHNRKESPVVKADIEFYDALYNHEMYSRTVSTLYGDNAEARKLLREYQDEIDAIKYNRKQNRNKIAYIFLAMIALALILPHLGSSSTYRYNKNVKQHSEIYQLAMMRKTISPSPELSVHPRYSDYISSPDQAVLTIDVYNGGDAFDDYLLSDGLSWYKLRINNVKMVSTGKKLPNADTAVLNILLLDKNNNPVGKKYYPISLLAYEKDWYYSYLLKHFYEPMVEDNIYTGLENGEGYYYADFVAKDSTLSIYEIKAIADSVCYFTIY